MFNRKNPAMAKMFDRMFKQVDNMVWDLMTGSIGMKTDAGIWTLQLGEVKDDKALNPEVSLNTLDMGCMPIPAFAQSTPSDQIKLGDLIYSTSGNALGWVVAKNAKSFRLLKQDGTQSTWTPPKVKVLGMDTGVLVLRNLMNLLPSGQEGFGNLQGMLLPLMMTGMLDTEGENGGELKDMLPMMLMMQGVGGNGIGQGNSQGMGMMMQALVMQKLFK